MNFIYRIRREVFDPIAWLLSRRELRNLTNNAGDNAERILEVTQKYIGRGYYARIHAYQRRSEILQLCSVLQKLQPKTIVEIGTDKGGTFYIWCRLIRQLRYIASIDLPGGKFGGGYAIRRARLYREFLYDKPNAKILLLRNNSHNPATKYQLTDWLESRPIDFLYIDGDHTYAGVRQDFEMYGCFVRSGGVIAFHDILTKGHDHEVYKFWNEIKNQYQCQEIIENPSGSMGIGLLQVLDD